MDIKTTKDAGVLTAELTGRLDTNTSPELAEALMGEISGLNRLVIDMAGLEYISSAGLRSLLQLHKKCGENNARMDVVNANDVITDVLKMTGFDAILNISG